VRHHVLSILVALLVGGVLYGQPVVKSDQGRPGNQGSWPVRITSGSSTATITFDGGVLGIVNQGTNTGDGGSAWESNVTSMPVDSTSAFGALSTIQETPVTHLDFSNNFLNTEIIIVTLDGGATFSADGGRAILSLPATANGIATMESMMTAHYIPGQGMLCRFTQVSSACKSGQQTEIGCGTTQDGFFFGCCSNCETDGGSTFGVLRRSNSVDNWTPASQWNGQYGTTPPDLSKGYPYQIQFQWLGYGQIIYSIENPATGRFTPAHVIKYAGTSSETSARDPTFPLRAAIRQYADAGTGFLSTPSMGFYRQGPVFMDGPRRGFGASKTQSSTVQTPVFTLKNNLNFNNLPNHHAIHLDFISWDSSGNANSDVTITLWKNTGLNGTPSFTNFSVNSFASTDTAATGIDGGGTPIMVVQSAANTSERFDLTTYNIMLNPGDTITFAGLAASGTPTLRIGISWMDDF